METSVIIALIALIVSIGSLLITWWATNISKTSLEHAIETSNKSDRNNNEREKLDLLQSLSEARAVLERTRIDIGALKANFDAETQPVREPMKSYTSLFNSYLPKIEITSKQIEEDWSKLMEYSDDISFHDLIRHKAIYNERLTNFEIVRDNAIHLMAEFEIKLKQAKEYVSSATR